MSPLARSRRARVAVAVTLAALAALVAVFAALRTGRPPREALPRQAAPAAAPRSGQERSESGDPFRIELGDPSPSTGWEEAAGVVALDLRRLLEGRPRAGAYEEARAEAARQDLALYPPDRAHLRRLLLGGEGERLLALAALTARPDIDDDLLRIVLRSQRPEDDDLVRLLGAEIVQALPPDLLSRHDDDLLQAFEREANPLVLAVALPALEQLDAGRLRALLRTQLARAGPEMLPVLLALARSRLGPRAFQELAEARAGVPSAGP